MEMVGRMNPDILNRWLAKLSKRDPKLHQDLEARRQQQVLNEATREGLGPSAPGSFLETIVREGRPALLVKNDRITLEDTAVDSLSREITDRLMEVRRTIEPYIPLVGRIDVANFAGTAEYLGTGWLIEPDIVVTNRHVAELIARWDGGTYRFHAGRFGNPLQVSVNYRRELGSPGADNDVCKVERVIWIEPNARAADFALLKVARKTDGSRPDRIELADVDPPPGTQVAVIGYPARAPAHVIADQAWMDRIYGSIYDVKRVAPGLIDDPSDQWSTHDCTTLGGNSGSVVMDLATGRSVGLHFAGLYMIENYAVPSSILQRYRRERPWQGGNGSLGQSQPARQETKPKHSAGRATSDSQAASAAAAGAVSITIPLTISVALGQPVSGGLSLGVPSKAGVIDIDAAVEALARENRPGVLAVTSGYVIDNGRLTDAAAIVVSAHPDRIDAVQAACPSPYSGYPVVVRPASIEELLRPGMDPIAEAVTSIRYNDEDRTGAGFRFDEIEEDMRVVCHVGPERSWEVLSRFLESTKNELVSSIYEFHASHIAEAVEKELEDDSVKMKLVLDPKSRNGSSGPKTGEFDREQTLRRWTERFEFEPIFVPMGSSGLVASAYHIKVTVRDGKSFWLSSGNWKGSSQPLIKSADRMNPSKTNAAGNREWHVVVDNERLAAFFRNHILADFAESRNLGGTPEAVGEEILIDVPVAMLEAIALEGPPAEVLEPLEVDRRVRVKPLLTPDDAGAVYGEAVLELTRSATRQLVFQNQYIKIKSGMTGYLSELVDALVERSREIDDLRIILRSDGKEFWDNVSELKRRGLDVEASVRRLPKTHTKGIVIDGQRVLVGSHNWSAQGVTLNRDASLLFDDAEIAQYYLRAFELDWQRASELTMPEAVFTQGAARLAVGDRPPPGFVRMTLADYLEG